MDQWINLSQERLYLMHVMNLVTSEYVLPLHVTQCQNQAKLLSTGKEMLTVVQDPKANPALPVSLMLSATAAC